MRPIIIGVLWVVSVLGAVALYGAGRAAATAAGGPDFATVYLGLAIDVVAYASVGALLMLRRPGNVIGVALGAAALLFVVTFLGFTIGAQLTIERGMDDAVAGAVGVLGGLGIYPTLIVAGPLLALLFPDGRPPGPMFRRTLRVVAGVFLVLSPLTVIRPSPSGDSLAVSPFAIKGVPWLETATAISDVVLGWSLPAMMLLAVVGVIVRFRRAPGVERQQLKWFVAAVVLVAVGLTLSTFDGATDPTAFDLFAVASLSLIPLAIGVAILRYRLYEIDRIISRTLAYAVVTAVLAEAFVGVNLLLGSLIATVTARSTLARRSVHPAGGRSVPAAPHPGPGTHRSPIQSGAHRRAANARRIRRALSGRDGPEPHRRRRGRDRGRVAPAGPCGAVAAESRSVRRRRVAWGMAGVDLVGSLAAGAGGPNPDLARADVALRPQTAAVWLRHEGLAR